MKQEAVPSRESTNAFQVNTILAVIHNLEPFLVEPARDLGQTRPELDGDAVCSASATFIKACDRLDQILADSTRWSMDAPNELYRALVATQVEQQAFIREQTAAAKIVQRPAFLLKPTLLVWEAGYLAFYGNPNNSDEVIAGRGPTPEAALADFDAAFARTPAQQVQAAQAFETPKPRRTKKPE